MAEDKCCNLRCFSYFVAILTIVGGVLVFLQIRPLSIVGGLLLGVACLLVAGIYKEKENYVLTYVITNGVLLVILLILCIVALGQVDQSDLDDDIKRFLIVLFYTDIGGVVVSYLLLIPVFLFYKQLVRKNNQQLPPEKKA